MSLFSRIRKRIAYNRLTWWQRYSVQIHQDGFSVSEARPDTEPLLATASWSQIAQVTFLDGGLSSDQFVIHLKDRDQSICVPTESLGGVAFWQALVDRGLFPQEVSGLAVRSSNRGSTYTWPPLAS